MIYQIYVFSSIPFQKMIFKVLKIYKTTNKQIKTQHVLQVIWPNTNMIT